MARNRQIIHQWLMLRALQEGPKTIEELRTIGECSTRHVYREMEGLQEVGFPLYSDRDEDGTVRWRLAGRVALPARRAA